MNFYLNNETFQAGAIFQKWHLPSKTCEFTDFPRYIVANKKNAELLMLLDKILIGKFIGAKDINNK